MYGDPRQLIHRHSYSVSQKRLILCKTAELIWALVAGSKLILHSFWPALRLSRNQPRIMSVLKYCLVRSASYFTRFRPNVLRMYTFTHVLGYFLGLFCVRQLCMPLSISLPSVESLISLLASQSCKKIALSSSKEWYVNVFSGSLKIFFLPRTIQKLHLPLFFLCKSCLTNLLLQLSSCLSDYLNSA